MTNKLSKESLISFFKKWMQGKEKLESWYGAREIWF